MKAPFAAVLVLVAGCILLPVLLQAGEEHHYVPKDGFVPDAATAIKIAVAIWNPIYGEKHIAQEKPYVATLKNEVWTVQGSLPKNMIGGTAIAEISKNDGRIIRVSHAK